MTEIYDLNNVTFTMNGETLVVGCEDWYVEEVLPNKKKTVTLTVDVDVEFLEKLLATYKETH